jgi:hypothetical protein
MFITVKFCLRPIPVTEQSKARVCGHSLAGIAGSNSAGGMNVCLLCDVVKHTPLRRADHSSRGVLPSVGASLCVIRCNNNPLHLQWERQTEAGLTKEGRKKEHSISICKIRCKRKRGDVTSPHTIPPRSLVYRGYSDDLTTS